MKEWAPVEVEFYKKHYTSASKGNYDIYVVFAEKGLSLLNPKGRLGFILPHKFFQSQYGEPIRDIISKGKNLSEVVHFGSQQIFEGATTYTCLMFLNKSASKSLDFVKVDNIDEWRKSGVITKKDVTVMVEPAVISTTSQPVHVVIDVPKTKLEWNFVVGKDARVFEKLKQMPNKLGDVADIFVGLQTSADNVFIMDLVEETPKTFRLKSKSLNTEWTFEKGLLHLMVSGTDVNRYAPLPSRQYILFPYKVENNSATLIDFKVLTENYPKTADYLRENKKRLEEREKCKIKGSRWYGYIYLKNMIKQSIEKLCIPRLVDKIYATYDIDGNHYLDNVDVGGITLKPGYQDQELKYLLALLNSKLLQWYFPFVSVPFRGGWLSANKQFLSQLPIHIIDFNNPSDKAIHDKLVSLVDLMLELHKKKNSLPPSAEREKIEREIAVTDEKIDDIIYGLYGITDEERKIIEGKS